jgi:hypothetical protein
MASRRPHVSWTVATWAPLSFPHHHALAHKNELTSRPRPISGAVATALQDARRSPWRRERATWLSGRISVLSENTALFSTG